jgi:hypothetical protein
MKRLSLIFIASFALVTIQGFSGVFADGGGVPLSQLAGRYADTLEGSFTLCFKPDFSDTENCSTSGAIPVSFNGPAVGQITQDKDGNLCGAYIGTAGVPGSPGNFPPQEHHFVGKVTDYDPATGTGDKSFTDYIGGKCNGTKFDSAGAVVNNTSTGHFVASDNGNRVDLVVTTLQDSAGDIGAFNFTSINLKQKE